jgi:hypothetical protein
MIPLFVKGNSVLLSASSSSSSSSSNCTLPSNLQTGLVGYWPFCGNTNDASGNGNNGTISGANLTSDRFGNTNSAYSFNGSNNYISLSQPFFNGSNSVTKLTYSVWFKCSQLPQVSKSYMISAKEGFWKTIYLSVNSSGKVYYGGSQPNPQRYFGIETKKFY